MAKEYFIPKQQAPYVKWHDTLKGGVSANTPGATAADVTMLAADNTDLHVKTDAATKAENAAKAAHADLNAAIATSKTNARLLAQRIKTSTTYTPPVGDLLGIIGAEDSTDMTQEKPRSMPSPNWRAWWKLGSTKRMPKACIFTKSAIRRRASPCSPAKPIRHT